MPYIGKSPGVGLRTRYNYTATASQTSFSGADNSNVTLTYTDTNYTDVYLNGVLLKAVTDYTSTTGTSIVLASGAAADDILEVVVYDAFSVADTVSAVDGGTFASNVSFGADISSSTLGTSNFRAGVNAGNSIASGGNFNTVVGDEAGTAITTGDGNSFFGKGAGALTVGTSYNVGVGDDALGANVATGNTAVGSAAMASTTSGHSNVAMGLEAGRYLTTGDSSAFIGYKAGQGIDGAKLTGDFNVAVGFQAGLVLQGAANRNVLVGANSGDAITTGQYNTAVGHDALTSVAGADNNVGIGLSAGAAITSGAGNTACGTNSGYFVSTGSNNTFLGFQAGQGITGTRVTGDDNTAVGKDAGLLLQGAATNNTLVGAFCGDAITTGDTNTAMGHLALTACNTGTNNIAIGNSALAELNTGVNNIAMGSAAGNNTTSGTKNVMIGVGCNASAADGEEQIVIATTNTSGAGDNTVRFGSDTGTVYISLDNSTVTWVKSSDERLKENIETSTAGLSFINDLRPVTFDWKKKRDIPEDMKWNYPNAEDDAPCLGKGKKVHGFIAQEVEAAIANHPEVVEGNSITDIDAQGVHGVGEGAMIPMMVRAMQELSTKLDAALARIEELES